MTLILQRPTGSKLTLRQTWQPMDPDAAAYITAVETADGQALEEKVKIAIDNFVLGCKADGIWSAIKASCILAGARTLAGALVPLVGTAPTNYNFVSGDYNRETGLIGNGSTKYLDSNRNNNADPQDSKHLTVYAITGGGTSNALIGNGLLSDSGNSFILQVAIPRAKLNSGVDQGFTGVGRWTTGFIGINRSDSSSFQYRDNGTSETVSDTSVSLFDGTTWVFARGGVTPSNFYDGRLSFYSIGESLDLAKLDARVTDLINAIGVAIP